MTECQIDQLIEDIIEREGDYVNHPADRGGPTRWGVTEAVARRQGYLDDMRRLPRSDAAAIYKRLYWLTPLLDKVAEIAPKLAEELFDTGVNMGSGTAIAFLQRALNALNRNGSDYGDIAVDRRIGPATLLALGALLRKGGANGEVVTGGGLMGKVTKVADDHVEVEIAPNVRVKAIKATLTNVTPRGTKAAND